VKVAKAASQQAAIDGVQIFSADIIYHLFDQFKQFMTNSETVGQQIHPCILTIQPEFILKTASPIIIGVLVQGTVEVGAPLCIPSKKFLEIGRVTAIRLVGQEDPYPITAAYEGQTVILKIEQQKDKGGRIVIYGRDFDSIHPLYSRVNSMNQLPFVWRRNDSIFMKGFKRVFGLKGKVEE